MNDAKHTPGPWVAHQEAHGLFVSAKSFCIARLGDGMSNGQQENAILIAAAPDLLAAAVEFMDGEGNTKKVREMFRAAIAKAKGE